MIREVPLQLRSVQVSARIAVEPCGPGCLLGTDDAFAYAIPGGMALTTESSEGVIRGVLFGTHHGTLIKAKGVPKPSFGWNEHFSPEAHRRALDLLRESAFPGVSRPERECSCSVEFQKVSGRIAWVAFSMHAARLAELFPVHPLRTREEAAGFIHAAWRVLSALNGLGISHGDPAFYNFAVADAPALIDLDQCTYTGESESSWDQNVFLYSTIVPVMAGFMTAEEIAAFVGSAMADAVLLSGGGARALVPAISHAMEYNSCVRQLRSLAMRHYALGIHVTETGAKLSSTVEEEQARRKNILSAAEERLQALQAAHKEMDTLRAAAAERLHAMLEKEQAITALNVQLRALTERSASLEAAAVERLDALLEKEHAIAALDTQLRNLRAQLEQTTAERDRLQQETLPLTQRIRQFEEETWREYLNRRWKSPHRSAARQQ
jgi:hypothetical protein